MPTAQKVVGLRSTATLSVMVGMFRVDVSIMPTHDKVGTKRPTRNFICPEHQTKLSQGIMVCSADAKKPHAVKAPVKAVEYPPKSGKFVQITEDEFKALHVASDAIVELNVRVDWIDPKTVEQTYFVWPSDTSWGRYFRVLYDTLASNDYAVGGTWNEEGTTKPVLFRYDEQTQCLLMYVTKYASCLRSSEAALVGGNILTLDNPPQGATEMMDTILTALPPTLETDTRDVLGERQWALVERKSTGAVIEQAAENDVRLERRDDLMEALRASVKKPLSKKERDGVIATSARKKATRS